ncbi:MAG: RidA family protein [Pseudomonadota bacterium]
MALHVNPPEVWQPFGAFSLAVVQSGGRIVHLKGQIPLDSSGTLVGRGDIAAQLKQTLDNIRRVLGAMGGEMGDILSLTHYTTDIEAFMKLGALRQTYFAAPYPVTTTLQVARLYDPEVLIEITAVAEIPLDRFRTAEQAA